MRFTDLAIAGAVLVEIEPLADERGFFARSHCEAEFARHGLIGRFAQSSLSFNARRGTVRGMHFSVGASAETKLVRCTRGAIADRIVDLRWDSPSYLRVVEVDLSAENRAALYVPAGVAHGFQTLGDDTELLYMIDRPYDAEAARGVRWNDPAFAVTWPEPISVIAPRDLGFADWPA